MYILTHTKCVCTWTHGPLPTSHTPSASRAWRSPAGPCVGRELSPQMSESPHRSCSQWQLCRPVLRGRRALKVSRAEGKAQDLFISLSYRKYHVYRTEGPADPLGLKSPESPRSSCCLACGQSLLPRRKVLTAWKSGHVLLCHPVHSRDTYKEGDAKTF